MSGSMARNEGMYPGLIRDISEAKSLGDVIDIVPEIGQRVESVPCLMEVDGVVQELPKRKIIRNAETGVPYSIVTDQYGMSNHQDFFQICGEMLKHGATLDTAGTLADGGRTWIRMNMPEGTVLQENGQDVVVPSMMMLSDHTSENANLFLSSLRRPACNNELTAMIQGAKTKFSFRHRRWINERVSLAGSLMAESAIGINSTLELFQVMANKRLSSGIFTDFAMALLNEHRGVSEQVDEYGVKTIHAKRANEIDELISYFESGNQGAGDTCWGAYQSVTGWLDHKHEQLEEGKATRKKLESMWSSNLMGDGARLKARAFKKLENFVTR
jgi:phage/plasmid-like protein (TIGR03299 family)